MSRVDRQRREHRKNAVIKYLAQRRLRVWLELIPSGDFDVVVGQRRQQIMREQHRLRAYQCRNGGGNVLQLLMRPATIE